MKIGQYLAKIWI